MPEATTATVTDPNAGAGTATATVTPTAPEAGDLGEGGKRALEAERRARAAAEKQTKDLQAQLDKIEQDKLSDIEKAQKASQAAETRAAQAEARALRQQVALEKGLPAKWVDRLRGDTAEALAADADEILTELGVKTTTAGNQPAGPRPDLAQGARGGTATQGDPGKEFEVFLNKQLNR